MSDVYTQSKLLHFPKKLEDIRERRISAPIHVRLKPTNRCNHHCAYCCYRNSQLPVSELMNGNDEIPAGKMKQIVEDLADMGVRAVTFSGGGEPLLYPHLPETVQQLAAAGIRIGLLTHGGRLEGALAEDLARHATWVRISMDSAERALYGRIRNVAPSEFDKVCDNIGRFIPMAKPRVQVGLNFVVTRENGSMVLDFLKLARDMGVDHVKISYAVLSTRSEKNAEFLAPFYDSVKAQIAEACATLADDRFHIIDKVFHPESEDQDFSQAYSFCPYIQCTTVIAADQNVYVCHDKAYTRNGQLGSIRDRSFRELWNSPATHDRLFSLRPASECRHHCTAHSVNLMLLDYMESEPGHLDFV